MLIFLVVVAVLLALGVWLTTSLLGMLVTLAVAAVVGFLADKIVPGELPCGWLGAIVAGLAGSWIGTAILGPVGPSLAGIRLIPAFIGAVILAFLAQFIMRATAHPRRGVHA